MGKGLLEKTIGKIVGGYLITLCALTVLPAHAQTSNAQDRALQARIDSCNNAIAKRNATKQEVDRANAERLCKHSALEPKKVQANPQAQSASPKSQQPENKNSSSGSLTFWVIVLGILIAISAVFKKKKSRSGGEWKKTQHYTKPYAERIINQPRDHLSITLSHKYEKQRLLNRTEENVYNALLRMIYTNPKSGFKINMQTSLGEILKCDPEGFKTINSKRVDFCLVDKSFMPIVVIEVNGTGHYQGDALERDEVKRAAIESAGIKYIALRENENFNEKLNRELSFLFQPAVEKIIN